MMAVCEDCRLRFHVKEFCVMAWCPYCEESKKVICEGKRGAKR